MKNKSPEAPLQIVQLRSEQDLREFAKLVNSSFPVSEPSQPMIEPLVDFLRTAQVSAPHIASLAVFNRSETYLSPIMDIHTVWELLGEEQVPEVRRLRQSYAGLYTEFERDFTALLQIWYPQKYPTLENLISRVAAEEYPHATSLRVVACAQFQR